MARPGEVMRMALLAIGGAVLLQVPLFFAIWKLTNFSDHCPNLSSRTGQTLGLEIESATRSNFSSSDCALLGGGGGILPLEESSRTSSFKPLSVANHPFVLFSVYRDTLETFYVLGIVSVMVRKFENERPVYRCEWHPSNGTEGPVSPHPQTETDQSLGSLVTEAEMLYVKFDENNMAYVPALVNCTFNQSVGTDGKGGHLRLHVSHGPSHWGPHYDVEEVLIEKTGEIDKFLWTQKHSKPHKYAFCGPPIYGTMKIDWIREWLAYHHYIWKGDEHFYFYDVGGIDLRGREMLEPWIKSGLLTTIDALGGDAYPSWYRNQLLFINDCIHRTKFTALWTFFFDLDELLHIPAPNSLDGLLEEHTDAPWMTFANLPFSMSHCRVQKSSEENWQLERLQWRNKQPECMHDDKDPWLCIAAPGRRKYLVNPRKVFASGVHRVALPGEGGVDFHGSIARVHHFHGVLSPNVHPCGITVNFTNADEKLPDPHQYDYDDAIAALVPKAREYAGALLGPFTARETAL